MIVYVNATRVQSTRQARRKRRAGGAVQFLEEQLTLSQTGGADYAHHSTTSPPGFSDLATALQDMCQCLQML